MTAVVYFVRCTATDLVKIGYATSVASRVASLQTGSAAELVLEMTITAETPSAEKALHARFADRRVRGEWFRLTPEEVREIGAEGVDDLSLRAEVGDALRRCGLARRHAEDIVDAVLDLRLQHCATLHQREERLAFAAWAHERFRGPQHDAPEVRAALEVLLLEFARDTGRASLARDIATALGIATRAA